MVLLQLPPPTLPVLHLSPFTLPSPISAPPSLQCYQPCTPGLLPSMLEFAFPLARPSPSLFFMRLDANRRHCCLVSASQASCWALSVLYLMDST